MNKVCAVIVTCNRPQLLQRNIESILRQSLPADILVFDNASQEDPLPAFSHPGIKVSSLRYGDDVPVHMRSEAEKKPGGRVVTIVHSETNIGGAGGFGALLCYAFDAGYEYIWMMDDDGYCLADDTLKLLADRAGAGRVIVNSLVVCEEGVPAPEACMSFSINGHRYLKEIEGYDSSPLLPGEISTFNSTLFSRALVKDIGTVDPSFFIYGDDWDFLERARAAGYKTFTVTGSLYFHPDSGMGHTRVFGQLIDLRERSDEHTYFYERNSTHIFLKYRSKSEARKHCVKAALKYLLFKKRRFHRLYAALVGMLDAWHGRMGYTLHNTKSSG